MDDLRSSGRLAVIIRVCGERTATLCETLLRSQLGSRATIELVGNKPFPLTLQESIDVGIKHNHDWTLCVDADVIPFPDAIKALLNEAELMDESVSEVQGLIFDRLTGGWRPAGVHLYRTSILPKAQKLLSSVQQEIRPETSLLNALATLGNPWKQIDLGFGLHDFCQYPQDVFRKSYLHACKHKNLISPLRQYWLKRNEDYFLTALMGLEGGITHTGDITLDRTAEYFHSQDNWENHQANCSERIESREPLEILRLEEQMIRALGYEQAPVWDWAERYWVHPVRVAALDNCLKQLLEKQVHACVLKAGNTVSQRVLNQALKSWGIDVVESSLLYDEPISKSTYPVVKWLHDDALEILAIDGTRKKLLPDPYKGSSIDYTDAVEQAVMRIRAEGVVDVIVYGAGAVAEAFYSAAMKSGIKIHQFLQTSLVENKTNDSGMAVSALEQGLARYSGMPIVIASFAFAKEMACHLLKTEPNISRQLWFIR